MHGFRRSMAAKAMADWTDDDRATFARLLGEFVERFDELTARDSEAGRPQ